MNKLFRKAAALLTAGVMAAASFCTECFAANTSAQSGTVTAAYEAATLPKPTYTVKGTKGVRKIKLKTSVAGGTIYYTANGSVPTTSSKVYEGKLLKITKDVKIRAIVVKNGQTSAVMTKTFRVATKVGDVTGDGSINNNDYNRFRSYAQKTTSYVCKDNLDCDANGKITYGDIEILKKYLDGKISSLPYTGAEDEDPEDSDDEGTVSASLGAPGITVYKSYGGKKIEFKSSVSGVTFYYTIDGSRPTTSSKKYSGKFLLPESATVKVIAAKDGAVSEVSTLSVSLGTVGKVSTSTDPARVYSGSVNVDLICDTPDSRIYYTTDGSDPMTSTTAQLYNGSVKLTKTTTIKAYAQAMGCEDGQVSTYKFSFGNDYTLSGTVWEDSNSNGIRDNGEKGIAGLTVYALNTQNTSYSNPTKTDSYGNYSFSGLNAGSRYQIVVEFNAVMYRPYNKNLLNATMPTMEMRYGGAFDTTGNRLTSLKSYSEASVDSYFAVTAHTGKVYTETTLGCDLGLVPMYNSYLSVSIETVGHNTSNNVMNGDSLTYTVTLTNNSPTQTLSDVKMGLYFTDAFSRFNISQSYTDDGTRYGYRYYTMYSLVGSSGLMPGRSISFKVTGTVNAGTGTKMMCYAEVLSYRFENSLYDCYSIPGNLSVGGYLNYGEKDEATSVTVTVTQSSGGNSDAQILYSGNKNFYMYQGEEIEIEMIIRNISSTRDYDIDFDPISIATLNTVYYDYGTEHRVVFKITANSAGNSGRAFLTVGLRNNASQKISISFDVDHYYRTAH